ncbi:hypothetical protein Dfri01_59490 [Dyadobacter frigoris]|uniref:hypothetical protein n=1 Tax=Dyadobacter frigoris TaxID=2576211 RepID=UPI0024A10B65|nr:hypothetical protein [Dyadobacter frigoris]GLU56488.1 hypothetical protein Dfri01_59490 [Dyadobacter frigoris]
MTNKFLTSPIIEQINVFEEIFSSTLESYNEDMDQDIFDKLDEIYKEPEALKFFNKIVFTMCLKLIVLGKHNRGEFTKEEFERQSEKPSEKNLMEPYGLSYLQYRALKEGKGTGPNMMTLKRAVDRSGYKFDKVYYSEQVINIVFAELEKIKKKNQVMSGFGIDIKSKK